jgi:hypothetical protein
MNSSAKAWHDILRPEQSSLSLSLNAASVEDCSNLQEMLELCGGCDDVAKNGLDKELLMTIYARVIHLAKASRQQQQCDVAMQLMAQFAPYVVMFVKEFSAYDVRLILTAYAASHTMMSVNVSHALQRHVVATIHTYDMQDTVDVLWSCAKNNITDAEDLRNAIGQRILTCIPQCTHKQLANVFWSCATLNWKMPPPLAKSLEARALTLGPGFNSQVW